MTDSQNQDRLFENCKDDPVVAHAEFPETGKLPFKKKIMVGSPSQFFFRNIGNIGVKSQFSIIRLGAWGNIGVKSQFSIIRLGAGNKERSICDQL